MENENPKLEDKTEQIFSAKVENLEQEVKELKAQNLSLSDYLVANTIQEEQLSQVNNSLQTEIIEHQQTEVALGLRVDQLSIENKDLEIMLDTTTSHGDINEALLYEQTLSLAHEVTIDSLTQIANRRAFDQKLEVEWQRLARENLPLSLLLCDIDFFKRYNDCYGHPAGDDCLQSVAKAIESCLHRPADLAARYGGEEFAVILPNTLREGATFIAEQICQVITNLNILHKSSFVSDRVSISIGISTTLPEQQVLPRSLLESADKGLYLAKDQGRNRAVFGGN